jgi:prepilin peptidase CpaA
MDDLSLGVRVLAAAVFAGALLWAAVSDVRTFEVPNGVSIAILAAFPFLAVADGIGWEVAANHLLTGGAALVVGFGLFVARVMGAGDAKLLAAVSLWMGWPALAPYLFFVALAGGVFSLLLVIFRRLPLPDGLGALEWVRRLHERKKDIPYAVALALPAIFMLPRTVFPGGVAAWW